MAGCFAGVVSAEKAFATLRLEKNINSEKMLYLVCSN
jgi:hypothetical protein